jgi:hypothetical protein
MAQARPPLPVPGSPAEHRDSVKVTQQRVDTPSDLAVIPLERPNTVATPSGRDGASGSTCVGADDGRDGHIDDGAPFDAVAASLAAVLASVPAHPPTHGPARLRRGATRQGLRRTRNDGRSDRPEAPAQPWQEPVQSRRLRSEVKTPEPKRPVRSAHGSGAFR